MIGTRVFDNDTAGYNPTTALGVQVAALTQAVPTWTGTTTVTGWSWPVGVRQGFRCIVIPFRASNAANLPKAAAVTVRATNSAGALLGSARVGVSSLASPAQGYIVADFGTTIANAGGLPLWVGLETDGAIQLLVAGTGLYPVAGGYPQVAYSIAGNPVTPAWAYPYSTQIACWIEFYGAYTGDAYAPANVQGQGQAALARGATALMPGIKLTTSLGLPGQSVPGATTSYFSGWGQYAGNITTPFDAVSLRIYPNDAANLPTLIVVRVRRMPTNPALWTTDSSTWEIIAQSAPLQLGTLTDHAFAKIVAALDRTVSGECWVEMQANGYFGLDFATGSPIYASPIPRYQTRLTLAAAEATTVAGGARTWALGFGTADWANPSALPLASGGGSTALTPTVTIALPTNAQNAICCLEGVEANLYWQNVIRVTSRDGTLLDADDVFVDVVCTKGVQLADGWRYTPLFADAGNTTLTVNVYEQTGATLLATATCTLRSAIAARPATPVTRKLLVIGDSTTANGYVLAELVNLFAGDTHYTLTLVGTNTGNQDDADGDAQAVACDAISGWRLTSYGTAAPNFTNDTTTAWTTMGGAARTGSVFSNGGAFDFAHYLTAESITLAADDWVFIALGINDVYGATTDDAANTIILTLVNTLNAWITSIKAAVTGIRIGVALVLPAPASQDAFGTDCLITLARYRRNRALLTEALLTAFDTTVATNVYVLPINAVVDAAHNWAYTTPAPAVNARNATTYAQQSGGVHPGVAGYYQVADCYRAFLKTVEA